MITAREVMSLLLTACPSFSEAWSSMQEDDFYVDDDGNRLNYLDAGEFARHLVATYQAGAHGEVQASFDVIERLHLEGDPYVRELATIGYLEGIQNAADADQVGGGATALEPFLGAESARWWRGLDAFWTGSAPYVRATDPTDHSSPG